MQSINIVRETEIIRTPRLMQMEGIFDLPISQRSGESWNVNFDLPEQWNVGVIVGPSGSGKTTVARELFDGQIVSGWDWPERKSIVDGFPASMGIKEIVALLSSVGFSSPPSWCRPFHVLSNGEQFRANMARTLAEMPELSVVDEFTSVVDRNVAQIGSAAIAKTVRKRNQKFIAVACHYDILEWLEPDWIYQPHINQFELARGCLHRPKIELEIKRVHHSAWQVFRKHHYLDQSYNKSARAFVAYWKGVPVAFQSVIVSPHPHVKNQYRGHRAVCLPDFQGVGIGNRLIEYVASAYKGAGMRILSTTAHPAQLTYRCSSDKWRCIRKPSLMKKTGVNTQMKKWVPAISRLTSTWEYIGASMDESQARSLIYGE